MSDSTKLSEMSITMSPGKLDWQTKINHPGGEPLIRTIGGQTPISATVGSFLQVLANLHYRAGKSCRGAA